MSPARFQMPLGSRRARTQGYGSFDCVRRDWKAGARTDGPAPCTQTAAPSVDGAAPWTHASAPFVEGAAVSTHGAALWTTGAAPSVQGAAAWTHGAAPVVQTADALVEGAAAWTHGAAPVVQRAAPVVQKAAPSVQGAAASTRGAAPVVQTADALVEGAAAWTHGAAPVVQTADASVQAPAPWTHPCRSRSPSAGLRTTAERVGVGNGVGNGVGVRVGVAGLVLRFFRIDALGRLPRGRRRTPRVTSAASGASPRRRARGREQASVEAYPLIGRLSLSDCVQSTSTARARPWAGFARLYNEMLLPRVSEGVPKPAVGRADGRGLSRKWLMRAIRALTPKTL